MKAQYEGLVTDEADFMQRHLPLARARVVELGCGKADLARRLLERQRVASVLGFEVDRRQHAANLASPAVHGLSFRAGGAEATGLPDGSCDGVMMLKSLHHVEIPLMDQALDEIARILVPGGWLYVSEPVYGGDFNDIVKLFHDEGEVRAAAYAALRRAPQRGRLAWTHEYVFDTPLHFRDYGDFVNRIVRVTYSDRALPPDLEQQVRSAFERFVTKDGARFVRQMRVDILHRLPA